MSQVRACLLTVVTAARKRCRVRCADTQSRVMFFFFFLADQTPPPKRTRRTRQVEWATIDCCLLCPSLRWLTLLSVLSLMSLILMPLSSLALAFRVVLLLSLQYIQSLFMLLLHTYVHHLTPRAHRSCSKKTSARCVGVLRQACGHQVWHTRRGKAHQQQQQQ